MRVTECCSPKPSLPRCGLATPTLVTRSGLMISWTITAAARVNTANTSAEAKLLEAVIQ